MPTWWTMDVHIYQQTFYALFSIRGIKKNGRRENNIGIFFYIQSLLTSLGSLSKAFKNMPEYVDYLGLDLSSIPNVLDRSARNTNEHFEERYKRALEQHGNVLDTAIGHHDIEERFLLRYYNTMTGTIQFVEADFNTRKVEIKSIEDELRYIKSLEPIDYVFQRYDGYDKIF